jgi:GST-like protein
MIELHAWPTPNGLKISIMLEECGLPYKPVPIDIRVGEQFKPEFLKVSPNNKIPALVDPDGPGGKPLAIFESGAILIYLADKTGKFMPKSGAGRYAVIQWLMFQMGGIGPMMGQSNHFGTYSKEKIQYAIDRYDNESNRLLGVMDGQLGKTDYMAGDYSIADMATFPWVRTYTRRMKNLGNFPNLKRWFEAIDARPAVKKGLELMAKERDMAAQRGMTDQAHEILFGKTQYQKR